MKKNIPYRSATFFALLFLLLIFSACNNSPVVEDDMYIKAKKELFNNLEGDLSKPLIERIQKIPADLLKRLKDYDKSIGIINTDQYSTHAVTVEELNLINSYIDLLPPAHQTVFSKKVLGIYLIEGFSGAGLTGWCVDSKNHVYYYIILDSSLLVRSLDDWLSYREDSTFDKSSEWPTIRVRTQTDFKALMYVLLHEGAHVVDFEFGVTPFIDTIHSKLISRNQNVTPFTDGVWIQRKKPVRRYDFKHRADINIYGNFSDKGLIPRSQLPVMFSRLKKTPFSSFYAASAWYEDLADYLTCYHIEKKLKGSVIMELLHEGNVIEHYKPVKSPESQKRENMIQIFYN